MGKLLLAITFFANIFCLRAALPEIVISGNFPGGSGREIRLMDYTDLVSYREQEIASSVIDLNGNFGFRFSRFEPQYVFLRIDHARMGFFVEPGKSYMLQFDKVNFDLLNDRVNPHLNPWHFEFAITGDSLNNDIESLEDMLFDEFVSKHHAIYVNRNTAAFQSIVADVDLRFRANNNAYFQDYKRYKIAFYQRAANLIGVNDLMREYFVGKPVLYNNTQYMNLFNAAFDTYIFAGSRQITIRDLQHTVNSLGSYHALMDSLGKDTILRNEVLRELVMIKGLQSMFGNPDYNIENVEKILSYTSKNSKFHQHRNMAVNVLNELQYLRPGVTVPSVVLNKGTDGNIAFPEDFSGKPTLMVFWTSWCAACQVEFFALIELLKRHNDGFNVIGISADRHLNDYKTFLSRNELPWQNIHFDGDFRLLDTFKVKSFPTYLLIDKDGRLISFPAPKPSEGLVDILDRIIQPTQRPGRQR